MWKGKIKSSSKTKGKRKNTAQQYEQKIQMFSLLKLRGTVDESNPFLSVDTSAQNRERLKENAVAT